jgi:hypothetical protein
MVDILLASILTIWLSELLSLHSLNLGTNSKVYSYFLKAPILLKALKSRSQWLMLVILVTLEAENQDDHSSRSAQANSSRDPMSKITTAKWTRGVAQVVEHFLCKPEA